jgi:uncharacterized membrane protein
MRKTSFGIIASALVAVCGCTEGTPGGPGVQTPPPSQTYSANKPVVANSKETYSLRMPVLSTSMKQGETRSATIAISRGNDFAEDVSLKFSAIPEGITLEPSAPIIRKSESEVKINITASDNAALGDFTVKVIGHSDRGGPDAESDLKLAVSEK